MDLPDNNPKTRFGVTKPGIADIPMSAIFMLGLAMRDGKEKYGRTNWRENKVTASIYLDAAFRHLASWWEREEVASDSLVHHLGHVMACCAILIDAQTTDNLIDDRPSVPGGLPELLASLTKKNTGAAPAAPPPTVTAKGTGLPEERSNLARLKIDLSWLKDFAEKESAEETISRINDFLRAESANRLARRNAVANFLSYKSAQNVKQLGPEDLRELGARVAIWLIYGYPMIDMESATVTRFLSELWPDQARGQDA